GWVNEERQPRVTDESRHRRNEQTEADANRASQWNGRLPLVVTTEKAHSNEQHYQPPVVDDGPRTEQKKRCCENPSYRIHANVRSAANDEVSDGSQPPMTFDLSLRESAGSRSLDRFVRCLVSL